MKPIKSKKIRDSARGEECSMRVPNVCNFNPDTVCLCHVPTKGRSGMGQKCHDTFAFYGCSACHEWYDQRKGSAFDRALFVIDAISETQDKLHEKGLIKCPT